MGATTSSLTRHLRDTPAEGWPSYLRAESGLPGPRANLELADAFAAVADRATIVQFTGLDDEYLRFCGTQALGRLIADEPTDTHLLALLHERASDPMWRTREGAARALQLVGDADPGQLRSVVRNWCSDPNPYVRRAAVAAICEPRLLVDASTRTTALWACQVATESITALAPSERTSKAVRNLRQALGYCWSVAIAAEPAQGLAALNRLQEIDDPDVRWIVASNLTKARLRRVLAHTQGSTTGVLNR